MTTLTKRREGRPRSEEAHRAILEATNRILQRTSVRDLTIESIAKEAGVGKPTIYRWWPNKAAVVIDAFFDTMSPHMDYPKADTVADSLKAQLHQVLRLTRGKQGRLMAEILAEGQSDPGNWRNLAQDRRRTGDRPHLQPDLSPPACGPSSACGQPCRCPGRLGFRRSFAQAKMNRSPDTARLRNTGPA